MSPTEHAAAIRQSAELMLEAARAVEENVGLHSEVQLLQEQVERLRRENETLARNVPPEPPVRDVWGEACAKEAESVHRAFDNYIKSHPSAQQITRIVGQQWCRTSGLTRGFANLIYATGSETVWLILCNVHENVATGELTYEPVPLNDLPQVTP